MADSGVIFALQIEIVYRINNLGFTIQVKIFHVGKRDSYVVVAQLSPEFTDRLVDRWQALEASKTPKTFSEALRLVADL